LPAQFGVIPACRVLTHLTDDPLDECLRFVRRVPKRDGVAYANADTGVHENGCWRKRFPVVWQPFGCHVQACARHGLSVSLLEMTGSEKHHWTKHECLVVRVGSG
jgi:hypothetical protein